MFPCLFMSVKYEARGRICTMYTLETTKVGRLKDHTKHEFCITRNWLDKMDAKGSISWNRNE